MLFCPLYTVAIETAEHHKYYFRIFSQKTREEDILLRFHNAVNEPHCMILKGGLRAKQRIDLRRDKRGS
jgi:hypothetical protein